MSSSFVYVQIEAGCHFEAGIFKLIFSTNNAINKQKVEKNIIKIVIRFE